MIGTRAGAGQKAGKKMFGFDAGGEALHHPGVTTTGILLSAIRGQSPIFTAHVTNI